MFHGYSTDMQPLPAQPFQLMKALRPADELRLSIQMLINDLEMQKNLTMGITYLATRFNIKRRRLYDVINVFTALGCCHKHGLDHVIWLGKEKCISQLAQIRKDKCIDDKDKTLQELFPANGCIGIMNLTVYFLLLFHAMKTDHLDLRFVGQLFSRETSRYKTTLCKLYQISYILSAVGITKRTTQVCEVVLSQPYYDDIIVEDLPEDNPRHIVPQLSIDPLSIDALLNRPATTRKVNPEYQFVYDRRKEIRDLFVESIAIKSVIYQPDAEMEE